jgi:DNA modification methylase
MNKKFCVTFILLFLFFSQCNFLFSQDSNVVNNLNESIKIFRKGSWLDRERIHPTQKPIALYKWLLKNYAKEGDLILDTHVGSASSLIAMEDMGFDYVGYELDEEYYNNAVKRIENYRKQLKLAI